MVAEPMSQGVRVHSIVRLIGPPERLERFLDDVARHGVSEDVLQALRAGEVAPELAERARRELAAARPALDGAEHRTVQDRDIFDVLDEHLGLSTRLAQPLTVVDVPGY
jgi:hypothetical protein